MSHAWQQSSPSYKEEDRRCRRLFETLRFLTEAEFEATFSDKTNGSVMSVYIFFLFLRLRKYMAKAPMTTVPMAAPHRTTMTGLLWIADRISGLEMESDSWGTFLLRFYGLLFYVTSWKVYSKAKSSRTRKRLRAYHTSTQTVNQYKVCKLNYRSLSFKTKNRFYYLRG